MIDILFQCLDALEEYLATIQENADEGTNDNEHLIKELNHILETMGGEEAPSAEAPAAESTAAEAPADNAMEKWNQIELKADDKKRVEEAAVAGKNIYGVTVYVQESCLLKAARAFLVFKAIEESGEIICANPAVQDIEDERFGFDFSLIIYK